MQIKSYFLLLLVFVGCTALLGNSDAKAVFGKIAIEFYKPKRVVVGGTELEPLVEYRYELEKVYVPATKDESTVFMIVSDLKIYSNDGISHPWVGPSRYVVVKRNGEQHGKTIMYHSGSSGGFYLIGGIRLDSGVLKGKLESNNAISFSSPMVIEVLESAFTKAKPSGN